MLTVATLLWDANRNTKHFSECYDESWVEKLYRGFERNLTVPFTFRCFTERVRFYEEPAIKQSMLEAKTPDYGTCIEPYRLGEPMILVGLDTVILRNIDHLAEYCLTAKTIALPRDPYKWSQAINGVCLVPAGHQAVYENWRGENDMEWMRQQPHVFIDDIFPGSVVSLKGHVMQRASSQKSGGIDGVDICYLHGNPKMHELGHLPWINEHWR